MNKEKQKLKPGRHVISRGQKFEEVVYISKNGKSKTKHELIKAESSPSK